MRFVVRSRSFDFVGPVGFEPTTNDLKGRCSTIELEAHALVYSLSEKNLP